MRCSELGCCVQTGREYYKVEEHWRGVEAARLEGITYEEWTAKQSADETVVNPPPGFL